MVLATRRCCAGNYEITTVQRAVVGPAREGLAVVAALRGVIEAFRGPSERKRTEEEEAMFI